VRAYDGGVSNGTFPVPHLILSLSLCVSKKEKEANVNLASADILLNPEFRGLSFRQLGFVSFHAFFRAELIALFTSFEFEMSSRSHLTIALVACEVHFST